MKVRIIKTKKCLICESYLPRLNKQGFEYTVYDADNPANEKELDEWKIEKMPVIQLVDDDGAVKYQFPPGTFSPRAINHRISQLSKGQK
jgi:arsenate reductase-like glutaredoxin family protein